MNYAYCSTSKIVEDISHKDFLDDLLCFICLNCTKTRTQIELSLIKLSHQQIELVILLNLGTKTVSDTEVFYLLK